MAYSTATASWAALACAIYGFCQSNDDSDARRVKVIKTVVSIIGVGGIILLIGMAWFGYKCRMYKMSAAELDDGKSSWVLTSFHRVDFSERPLSIALMRAM
jgi:hypothetical protein